MTRKKDLKRRIREEMIRSGKSYTAARAALLGEDERHTLSDSLFLWHDCVQAVGWSPFARSDADWFGEWRSAADYTGELLLRLLEDGGGDGRNSAIVTQLVAASAVAAEGLDAAACLKSLEQADVLLTQSGWEPPTVRWGLDSLRSEFDTDARSRLADGPLDVDLSFEGAHRSLSLSAGAVYGVRGTKPDVPSAGRLCELRLFDHYAPWDVLVEYVDTHRFAVFELWELERVETALH